MFFFKKNYKSLFKFIFFKSLNNLKVVTFFLIFRLKYTINNYFSCKFFKILIFYKIYKSFVLKIKKNFFVYFINISLTFKSLKVTRFTNSFNLPVYHSNFHCFWVLKHAYLYPQFSFLNVFVGMDIIKKYFIKNNALFFYYIFQFFVKIYIKNNTLNSLSFNNIWYLINVSMNYLEKFFHKLINGYIFKNYSCWNIKTKHLFNSNLVYLYRNNKYKLCYIRVSNILYFYFFCKINFLLKIYKALKTFLKFILKSSLFYIHFNIFFFKTNVKIKKNKSFLSNINRNLYNISKLKVRLYLLLLFVFLRKNKYTFYKKVLVLTIIQTLLKDVDFFYNKKFVIRKILFISKNYLLI